jgi:hypothetical protein
MPPPSSRQHDSPKWHSNPENHKFYNLNVANQHKVFISTILSELFSDI